MASKIKGRSFDAPIKSYTFEGHEYNTLRVCVDYSSGWKGGGYFSATLTPECIQQHGGYQTRGFHITGTKDPIGSWTTFKLKEAARNSQKTINELSAALELAKDAIAYYFDQRNWVRLEWLVESVARMGYTPTIAELVGREMENINKQNSEDETMTRNVKGADLIGKTIMVDGGNVKYVIKSVEGDKLLTDFYMGDRPAMPCPIPLTQVESMISAGKWTIEGVGTTEEPIGADDVEEVEDVEPEAPKAPKADTVDMKPKAKPKREKTGKQKEQPAAKTGKFVYETYENKKGKTCAKIRGVSETDAAYMQAAEIHASATYERDKQGNKVLYLIFGPRYATAAKKVCDLLNQGKSVAACKAVIDAATEERIQRREEWKAKRAEREAAANSEEPKSTGKTYTAAEVEGVLRKAFGALADALQTNVKEFEPIITASLKMVA